MIGRELPARTAEEVARLVRALGQHRYVAGRLLLVHAFVFEAIRDSEGIDDARDAIDWARRALSPLSDIDLASRDERLWRRATERELAAALGAIWADDGAGARARAALEARLRAIDATPLASDAPLFDEAHEDDVFPALIDAGWELLKLAELDPERHKGAIDAFGERFAFDCAKFDEESAEGAPPPLQELPILGPSELVYGVEHGILRAPVVLWCEGSETYLDYVMRGVLKAAKLD
jgi:hypothetical protein